MKTKEINYIEICLTRNATGKFSSWNERWNSNTKFCGSIRFAGKGKQGYHNFVVLLYKLLNFYIKVRRSEH